MKVVALGPLQSSCLAGLSQSSQALSSLVSSNFASSFLVHTSFPHYSPFCFRGAVTIFGIVTRKGASGTPRAGSALGEKIKGERLCPSGTQLCDREQGHTSDRDYVNKAMELKSKCNLNSWDVTKDTRGMTEGERGKTKIINPPICRRRPTISPLNDLEKIYPSREKVIMPFLEWPEPSPGDFGINHALHSRFNLDACVTDRHRQCIHFKPDSANL